MENQNSLEPTCGKVYLQGQVCQRRAGCASLWDDTLPRRPWGEWVHAGCLSVTLRLLLSDLWDYSTLSQAAFR